ncbi:MAG TPA: DUF6510 family protein [Ktedonobacteraceae bacterium]
MMESKLDGNAAAGMLQAIFPFDMTLVQVTCAGCAASAAIGTLAAYLPGMGTVLRCPSCDNVLIRVAQIRGDYWLDMRGACVLHISEGV